MFAFPSWVKPWPFLSFPKVPEIQASVEWLQATASLDRLVHGPVDPRASWWFGLLCRAGVWVPVGVWRFRTEPQAELMTLMSKWYHLYNQFP